MKKIIVCIFMLVIFIFGYGCTVNNEEKVEITGPNEVRVAESIKLNHNYSGAEQVVWESSNENIAIVDDGYVIGESEGSVIIYLKIGSKKVIEKEITVLPSSLTISINGKEALLVGETHLFEALLSSEEEVEWESSNKNIATVTSQGLVKAISHGTVNITASALGNKASFELKVYDEQSSISLICPSVLSKGEKTTFQIDTTPFDFKEAVEILSSDESIVEINEVGEIVAKNEGRAIIKAYLKNYETIYDEIEIEVVKGAPEEIIINCEEEIVQGSFATVELIIKGQDFCEDIIFESSDESVILVSQEGVVLGTNKGEATITVYSKVNKEIKDSIKVKVVGYESEEYPLEDIKRVDAILANMTLSQKIGQMFVVGFNTTTFPTVLSNAIEQYNFGNVIYMAYNVSDPSKIAKLTNDLQSKMVEENTVPAFISIDQEGGRVARLTNGGTHFISNMAMAATGDPENALLQGKAVGKELRHYGINLNFAPVLDVNNNPENPIIGIRSYSDDPMKVAQYGVQLIKGMKESKVMACSKHFPGHGNTSVDSHYGLPTITTPKDKLYQTELAPFISSIHGGIDSIMTTHIIFTAIDSEYPATLSKKVLTGLLREELNYNGLIITDGMEMGAVTSNFGGHDKTAVMAVKAGADIVTYTSINSPITAHKALMNAVNSGEISEERINESVRRILLQKLKYNVLDDYNAKSDDITEMLLENKELNRKFAYKAVTIVKGDFDRLNQNGKTLFLVQDTLSQDTLNSCVDAINRVYDNHAITIKTFGTSINTSELTNIKNMVNNYDDVVIFGSDVKTKGYKNISTMVSEVCKAKPDTIVVAVDTPYDLLSYDNVNNYVCLYGAHKMTYDAFGIVLTGNGMAIGQLPINKEIFK